MDFKKIKSIKLIPCKKSYDKLDFSKLKFSGRIISSEETLKDVKPFNWEQFSEPCDFINCKYYLNEKCTNEMAYNSCPLMEARLELRAADDYILKMNKNKEN